MKPKGDKVTNKPVLELDFEKNSITSVLGMICENVRMRTNEGKYKPYICLRDVLRVMRGH